MSQFKPCYLDKLWAARWSALSVFVVVCMGGAAVSLFQEKLYQVDAQLYIAPKPASVMGEALLALGSEPLLARAVKELHSQVKMPEPELKKLLKNRLHVDKTDHSGVVSLKITAPGQPKTLRTILDGYLASYQAMVGEMSRHQAEEEHKLLNEQVKAAQDEFQAAEQKLQQFQHGAKIYNPDVQVAHTLYLLSYLDAQKKLLDTEISATRTVIAQGQKQLIPLKSPVNAVDMPVAVSSLDSAKRASIANHQTRLKALRAQQQSLLATSHQLNSRLQHIPAQALAYMKLKNSFDFSQERLEVLQKRVQEADLAKELSPVVILKQPSVPPAPMPSDVKTIMLFSISLGLFLALLSVNNLAPMQKTLHWMVQIKEYLPTDAKEAVFHMPALPDRQAFIDSLEKTNAVVSESSQRLIMRLENLQRQYHIRRLGLVPVGPVAESHMASVALALALTEMGNKIVLIDADYSPTSLSNLMRSLKLPISAAIEAGPCLSDYLKSEVEDFVDVIYPLGKAVYGSLIPAGEPLPGERVLAHRNLASLEANLSPNYNFVLYSLPSLVQSFETLALTNALDGVLLMAHPGKTRLSELEKTIQELSAVNTRILGVMLQPLKG